MAAIKSTLCLFVLGAITLVSANITTCANKTQIGCGKVDFGSCGNACCTVSVDWDLTPKEAYQTIKSFLKSGGEDNSFTYSTGPDAAGHNPGEDLTPYSIPQQYILQGYHFTTGGYKDVLNFNFVSTNNGASTTINGFSLSLIHGALGDGEGQTYKNLHYLFTTIAKESDLNIVFGCGKQ